MRAFECVAGDPDIEGQAAWRRYQAQRGAKNCRDTLTRMSQYEAGWYAQEDGQMRYFDGQGWTDH